MRVKRNLYKYWMEKKNTEERVNLEDPEVDGTIIVKRTINK